MTPTKSLLAAALSGVLLLSGCSSTSSQAQIDNLVADITNAANGSDAARMTSKADDLISLVNGFRAQNTLPPDEVDRIIAVAQTVKNDAALLSRQSAPTQTPAPTTPAPTTPAPTTPAPTTPAPTTPAPTVSRTPSASPTETPEPSKSPKPSKTPKLPKDPAPTDSPTPSQEPTAGGALPSPGVAPSASPAPTG